LINIKNNETIVLELNETDNRKWMPGEETRERLKVTIPADAKPGNYKVAIALAEHHTNITKKIKLGIKEKYMDKDGFYKISEIQLKGKS